MFAGLAQVIVGVVCDVGGGSKNRPLSTALAPAVFVIVISTFPEIVQFR